MTEIPVSFKDQSADFELSIDLEAVTVTIRLIYNTRVDRWFGEFSTTSNSVKVVPLVTDYLILNNFKSNLPEIKGDFIIQRVNNDFENPELSYDNFGTDWAFYYMTEAEVAVYKETNEIL